MTNAIDVSNTNTVCLSVCISASLLRYLSLFRQADHSELLFSSFTVLLIVCGIKSSYGDEDILLTIAKVGDRAILPCVNNAANQVTLIRN